MDSTGIAFIKRDAKTNIVKDTVLPYELMRDKDYFENMKTLNLGIIGHNRWATKGKVNAKNAHPFKQGGITLAHNGTLNSQHRLPDHLEYDTDSENICHSINKLGVEETWKKVDGAATLVWWDEKTATLNMLSNDLRPFHFIYTNYAKAIIWSSDPKLLERAIDRNGVVAGKKGEVFTLEKNILYSWKTGKKEVLTYSTKKLEPFTYTHVVHHNTNNGGAHMGCFRKRDWEEHDWEDVLPFDKKTAPDIAEKEFKEKYKNCVFCNSSLEHEHLTCTIVDDKVAVCEDCTKTASQADMPISMMV